MAARREKNTAPTRLQWSPERPSKPGWYWYRGPGEGNDPLVVLVDEAGYFQWPDGGFSEAEHTDGDWAGPLDPPEEFYAT